MLQLAFAKLLQTFSPTILEQGLKMVLAEGVMSVRLSEGLLHARVRGMQGGLYDVYTNLKNWPKEPAKCQCGARFNCEHAAASFLFLKRQRSDVQGQPALETWIAETQSRLEQPSLANHLTYYYLSFRPHQVTVKLAIAKQLKNDKTGKKVFLQAQQQKPFPITSLVDQQILKGLTQVSASDFYIANYALLQAMLETGRALDEQTDKPWQLGPTKQGTIQWELAQNGRQRGVILSDNQPLEVYSMERCIYIDKLTTEIGPLVFPYPEKVMNVFWKNQTIEPQEAASLANSMHLLSPEFPVPFSLTDLTPEYRKPSWVVALNVMMSEQQPSHWLLALRFDYDGLIVEQTSSEHSLYGMRQGEAYLQTRDFLHESTIWQSLQTFLLSEGMNVAPHQAYWRLMGGNLPSFLSTTLTPWIESQGGRVLLEHPIFYREIDEASIAWYGDMQSDKDEAFSIELGILVDGEKVNLVPLLVEWLTHYSLNEWLTLDDAVVFNVPLLSGRVMTLPARRIKPFIFFLLFDKGSGRSTQKIQVDKHALLSLQEAAHRLTQQSKPLFSNVSLTQLTRLTEAAALPSTPLPSNCLVTLRDYQHQGVDWLQALRETRLGGILADDMGLGKTVQTLVHLLVEKEAGRLTQGALILTPLSLIGNWRAEAERFTPSLRVYAHHGAKRDRNSFEEADIVLSTYGLLQRDKDLFTAHHFDFLILDEAQWIKNAKAKVTDMVQQMRATHRLCLSGTPFENHLGELWSLFHFLMPGLLGSRKNFKTNFQDPIEKEGDIQRQTILMNRIAPFLLRRKKSEVAKELPAKTDMIHEVSLIGAQRDLYESIRMSMEKRVREAIAKLGVHQSRFIVLDALLKLRQVCCDPRLIRLPIAENAYGQSAKLEALLDLLEVLLDEGRRVLVFSQFTSMLSLIEEVLKRRGYAYLMLTGQTKNRQALVDTFQSGSVPIFLMSLKAGGVGLNLTQADTVIHYDPWWNPAVEEQATDRTHRIGQMQSVFVYRLVAKGTVEESMLAMQLKKRDLFDRLLSPSSSNVLDFSEADITALFGG